MINETTLKEFLKLMSECNVIWGIGGSFLLEKYELHSNPADLDLWVQASDMPIIRQKFSRFEELKSDVPLPPEYHYKIMFYDIEVDFVARFIRKPNKNVYQYSIYPENIKFLELKNGVKIPCLYLEDWYVIYKLLRRDEKAEMIREAFKRSGEAFDEVAIGRSISCEYDNKLPGWLIQDISELTQYVNQISLFDEPNGGNDGIE